jgi:NitT/TauT family transport system permease protein
VTVRRPGLANFVPPAAAFVVVMGGWEAIVRAAGVPAYVLPGPLAIFGTLAEKAPILAADAWVTLQEALGGFLLGNSMGILVAVLFAHSRVVERGFLPYAIVAQTIPIIAIAPLVILWAGQGMFSKVIISAIMCLFPAIVNTLKGLKSVDPSARDLMKTYAATPAQVFFKLRMYAALPYVFSALKITSGLSVIGAIVGEYLGADKGIGFAIVVSSQRLETDFMFAAVAASTATGLGFFLIVSAIELVCLRGWHESALAPQEE